MGLFNLFDDTPFSWPQRIYISRADFNILWNPLGLCGEAEDVFVDRTISPLVINSQYLLGMNELIDGDEKAGASWLSGAVRENRNQFAAFLIANAAVQAEAYSTEIASIAQFEDEDIKLSIATDYFSLAGRCHIAHEIDKSRRYLDIGMFWLPMGSETRINMALSRRIGEIYYYDGKMPDAERWLWQAAPAGKSPLIYLSNILSEQGRFEEVIPIYIDALQYYPENPELWLGGAQAASEIGDLEKARWFLDGIRSPENLNVQEILLWARICDALKDYPCAKVRYQQVLHLDKSNLDALIRLQELRNK